MVKRVAILSSIILIGIGSSILLGILDNTILSRAEMDFTLPLPEDIAEEYRISRYPDVDKVILTGFFSDWDETDENYRMIPETDDPQNQKWTITLILPPGEHQYKFAVYPKGADAPVWTHDSSSDKLVYNGMNSYNSLVRIGQFGKVREILLYLIYGLLFFTLPQLFHLIFRKAKIRNTVMLLGLLLIISNTAFSLFNYIYDKQFYNFISRSIISILENDMEQSTDTKYEVFNRFLWHKIDKIGIDDLENRFRYASLIHFDENFRLIDFDYRTFKNYHTENPLPLESSGEFIYPYFIDQIDNFKEMELNEVSYILPAAEKLFYRHHFPMRGKALEDGAPFLQLSSKTYLFPYMKENRITGYTGVFFSLNSGTVIESYIQFNIGALLFFIAVIFILNLVKKEGNDDIEMLLENFAGKYGITSRESEILPYLLEGLTNKEIAETLNISKRTVDNHIYNILHKADGRNRVELIHIIKNSL